MPEDLVLAASDVGFATVARKPGTPFVLQAPSGAGGQGAYLVSGPEELARALTAHAHVSPWLLSRYAGDVTINRLDGLARLLDDQVP